MTTPINYQEAREQCLDVIHAIKLLREHPAVRSKKVCIDCADDAGHAINFIYMMLGAEALTQESKQYNSTNCAQNP